MELVFQDSQYILRNEYKQLVERDNIFVQTKNIISETSSITVNYIALAYMWKKVCETLFCIELTYRDYEKSKELSNIYRRLNKVRNRIHEHLEDSKSRCVKAWTKVFSNSPDMVQHYFFDEVLKVDNKNITTVLEELVYYVFESISEEIVLKEEGVKEFTAVLRILLNMTYDNK